MLSVIYQTDRSPPAPVSCRSSLDSARVATAQTRSVIRQPHTHAGIAVGRSSGLAPMVISDSRRQNRFKSEHSLTVQMITASSGIAVTPQRVLFVDSDCDTHELYETY